MPPSRSKGEPRIRQPRYRLHTNRIRRPASDRERRSRIGSRTSCNASTFPKPRRRKRRQAIVTPRRRPWQMSGGTPCYESRRPGPASALGLRARNTRMTTAAPISVAGHHSLNPARRSAQRTTTKAAAYPMRLRTTWEANSFRLGCATVVDPRATVSIRAGGPVAECCVETLGASSLKEHTAPGGSRHVVAPKARSSFVCFVYRSIVCL